MTSVATTGANTLAWKETTPGTFTRPLDTIESFFKWLADLGVPLKREHWDENEWLKGSFFTHTGEQVTVDSLFTSMEPAPIVSCHWLPGQQELILHGSHWRLDGIGSIKLADRLLAALCAVVRVGVAAPLKSYGLDLTLLFTPSLDEISSAYPDEESTPEAVKKMPQPGGKPPQNAPHLSSIGVIERWLRREYAVDDGEKGSSKITVEDVWLGGEMTTPALCDHVWTWRDQMTLAAVFNAAY